MRKLMRFFLLVLIVAGSFSAVWYFYLQPNNQMVPAFDEQKLNLVVEGEQVESKNQPKIVDEEILLPMETVKKYLDPNIYWDEKLKKVTITTKDKVIRMKTDSLEAYVNNKPISLKIPVSMENDAVYIPIEFLSELYKIEISWLKINNVIIIDRKNSIRQTAEPIDNKAVVRKGRSIRYPVLKKFNLDEDKPEEKELRVFEEHDKWYKVRTSEGIVGYIEKKYVVVKRMMVKETPKEEPANTAWKPQKGKINLVWEMMFGSRPNLSKIDKMEGLDVISPTWFQLANEKGTLINRADAKYVEWAHSRGYKIWALLANGFQDPALTKKFLNNTDYRDNLIREVLAYASLYKLDGINIDFENIYKEDKDALTQFVREITPFLREQGLVVSIDVTVPDGSDNWSLCYDRKALGEIVDYVMLMAYDQHWSTSPKAGSVAQITWVENNLKKVIAMVPREKLLLGLPFYTRVWLEEVDTSGKTKVSSKVLNMEGARKAVEENNAAVKWDEQSGQFYAEYKKDNLTHRIWIEDAESINLKSSLVHKYNLAGAASWRRSDEVPQVWEVLNKNLKVINSYSEWENGNKHKNYAYK